MTNTANTEEIKRLGRFIYECLQTRINGKEGEAVAEKLFNSGLVLPSSALVRPLVWERSENEQESTTKTPFGKIRVFKIAPGKAYWRSVNGGVPDVLGVLSSISEAETAVQNDYQSLIGSCLQGGGYTEEQVREAIAEYWKEEFGDLSDGSERDGYFVLGFVAKALTALKQQ